LVRYWFKKINKYGDENVEIVLVGNKIDLINDKVVDEERG